MNIARILSQKDNAVEWITRHSTVRDAARRMQAKAISALVVEADGAVADLVTDRDIAQAVAVHGEAAADLPLSQVATRPLIWLSPQDSVATAMLLMTDNRVRYLLVGSRWDMHGIISIGDLVQFMLEDDEMDAPIFARAPSAAALN